MMFWYGSHLVFWQVALMWIAMIAFWGLVIWGAYTLFKGSARRPERQPQGGESRYILDQRLAKGEIDGEEYRRLRSLIAHDERTPVGTAGGR